MWVMYADDACSNGGPRGECRRFSASVSCEIEIQGGAQSSACCIKGFVRIRGADTQAMIGLQEHATADNCLTIL